MAGWDALVSGYRRFRETGWSAQRERWAELKTGQSPKVMVIACSDSRVDPAVIFDTSPGEIFVVRNIANLVPPFEQGGGRHGVSAAIEFAVSQLEVEEIVIMGHGMCGGCQAALSQGFKGAPPGEGGFVSTWISLLDDARERVVARYGDQHNPEAVRAMEEEAVRVSIANLRTFPFIAEREERGALTLRGAYFAIRDGVLYTLDTQQDRFVAA